MKKHKKIISILGASSGSGVTYIGTRLAIEMGKSKPSVTFLEDYSCNCSKCENSPLVYYEHELYRKPRFKDFFFEKMTGHIIDNHVNDYKGVNWVVRTPESPVCTIRPDEVAGEYVIWDCDHDFEGSDLIICVIVPSKMHLMAGVENVRYLKKRFAGKTLFLFNNVTSGAALKKAESFLKIKADFCLSTNEEDSQEALVNLSKYIVTLF